MKQHANLAGIVLFAATSLAGQSTEEALTLGQNCKNVGDLWKHHFEKTNKIKIDGV